MDVILIRMLASTLWRYVHHSSLQEFQKSLLYTLSTYVAGDRWVVALAGNLVNLVDEDDTTLGSLHIIVGYLEQTGEDTLHILTYITSLGKYRSIHDGERYIEQLGNGTCQQCLTGTGTTHHDDVALFYFHAFLILRLLQTLIVIIDSNGKMTLGLFLSDDIFIEIFLDLHRLWHLLQGKLRVIALWFQYASLLHNLKCLLGALLTDKAIDTRDQQLHFILASSTEATCFLWHNVFSFFFFIPYYNIYLILYIAILIYRPVTCVPGYYQSYHIPLPPRQSSSSYGRYQHKPCRMEYENG